MDDEMLQALLDNFSGKTSRRKAEDEGEGDYRDFLANFMNATNHGADEDQISRLFDSITPERAQAMLSYGGGPRLDPNPTTQEFRGRLNRTLKSRR